MRLFSGIRERVDAFLHDEKLKKKLYIIIFESDTPMGKLFDTCLIGFYYRKRIGCGIGEHTVFFISLYVGITDIGVCVYGFLYF